MARNTLTFVLSAWKSVDLLTIKISELCCKALELYELPSIFAHVVVNFFRISRKRSDRVSFASCTPPKLLRPSVHEWVWGVVHFFAFILVVSAIKRSLDRGVEACKAE